MSIGSKVNSSKDLECMLIKSSGSKARVFYWASGDDAGFNIIATDVHLPKQVRTHDGMMKYLKSLVNKGKAERGSLEGSRPISRLKSSAESLRSSSSSSSRSLSSNSSKN